MFVEMTCSSQTLFHAGKLSRHLSVLKVAACLLGVLCGSGCGEKSREGKQPVIRKSFSQGKSRIHSVFLPFTKGSAHRYGPPKLKGKSIQFFPLTDFPPTPPPFLGKFKRHRKVKLSHSHFPELTTVNIWSYFPPGVFFFKEIICFRF